jgi:hypothetical protein
MIQIITILIGIGAIITAFFSKIGGWIVLALPVTIIILTYLGLKQKKWKHVPELSQTANEMLQKFGHYYAMPFAGRDFSASCSTLGFIGIGVAIIGLFKGFWWGIAIAIVNWIVMGFMARSFNPSNFFIDLTENVAHDQIIEYVLRKQKERVSDT